VAVWTECVLGGALTESVSIVESLIRRIKKRVLRGIPKFDIPSKSLCQDSKTHFWESLLDSDERSSSATGSKNPREFPKKSLTVLCLVAFLTREPIRVRPF
jgi:hypothetical protein